MVATSGQVTPDNKSGATNRLSDIKKLLIDEIVEEFLHFYAFI